VLGRVDTADRPKPGGARRIEMFRVGG